MTAADAMVGNSSSGIIEAPSFDLPVVDIGPRQEGRERATNTISVPHQIDRIRSAISRCLSDECFIDQVNACQNPYDYQGAGSRICQTLSEVSIEDKLLEKQLVFPEYD
jgi:UDP-N-acetylglucosamine 2-epimerase (non-hydrolysing)/GDP/UDP-N,N'-diacetylbacillosamine 2-epimerase (hydrolysing)